jgi:hypothetical protein
MQRWLFYRLLWARKELVVYAWTLPTGAFRLRLIGKVEGFAFTLNKNPRNSRWKTAISRGLVSVKENILNPLPPGCFTKVIKFILTFYLHGNKLQAIFGYNLKRKT